jgi:hypothetical protein
MRISVQISIHAPIFKKLINVFIQVALSFYASVSLSFINLTLENVIKFVMNLMQL